MFYLYTRHESQKEIIKKIEEFNLNLRKQRHDFLNHLEVIYGLIDFNEIDEAKKYLELFEASVKINSLVDKVKNPYMSIIISSFAKKAESKGVRFELYGFNDFLKFPLSPIHTTTVMSNLLKNSLENCRINDCVYIETEIAHGYFYLKISNDGKPVEILHGENFSDWQEQIYQGNSSKGENRGAGMLIIKDILSQYDDCNLIVLNREKPSFMLKLKITEGTEYD
jgi:sensor histidine kinase regulating citrate/malate metabolism